MECLGGTLARVRRLFKAQRLVVATAGFTACRMSLKATGGPGNANRGAVGVDMEFKSVDYSHDRACHRLLAPGSLI